MALKSRGAWALAVLIGLAACSGGEEEATKAVANRPDAHERPSPVCPLSGRKPSKDALLERPAVAVKVENHPAAYPLAGLEKAEIVYEEMVEGGITRFIAFFHCTDSNKVGPVRSAREIDPPIMRPITRILGAAGGNDFVRETLEKAKIINLDEDAAGVAMRRIERPGLSFEHTLYGSTRALRKLGQRSYDSAPADDLFRFGELVRNYRKARVITVKFSDEATIVYRWSGEQWLRSDNGEPLITESGQQIAVDNVIAEFHTVNYSRRLADVAGNPSIEIADATGSGRALLFRDGRVIPGRWIKKKATQPARFVTRSGEDMVLNPGITWVELVPDDIGEVKGSVTHSRGRAAA